MHMTYKELKNDFLENPGYRFDDECDARVFAKTLSVNWIIYANTSIVTGNTSYYAKQLMGVDEDAFGHYMFMYRKETDVCNKRIQVLTGKVWLQEDKDPYVFDLNDYDWKEIDETPSLQNRQVIFSLSHYEEERKEQVEFYRSLEEEERAIFRACLEKKSRDFNEAREIYEEQEFFVHNANLPSRGEELEEYKGLGESIADYRDLQGVWGVEDYIMQYFNYGEYGYESVMDGFYESANYWKQVGEGWELQYQTVEFRD